jgi:hypothetical protein
VQRADLLTIGTVAEGVQLTCQDTGRAAQLLIQTDETVLTRLPMTSADGVLTGVITSADVPDELDLIVAVHVGSPDDSVAVGRRDNELRQLAGVLMPLISAAGSDRPLLSFRYGPDGSLRIKRRDTESGEEGGAA